MKRLRVCEGTLNIIELAKLAIVDIEYTDLGKAGIACLAEA